jgi:elongation factor 3
MRAIAAGKVDGFPPKDVLRTVYVEHEIKPELAEYAIVDYVFADEALKGGLPLSIL